jgi:hypothetical protein
VIAGKDCACINSIGVDEVKEELNQFSEENSGLQEPVYTKVN